MSGAESFFWVWLGVFGALMATLVMLGSEYE